MSWKIAASLFAPLVLGTFIITDPSDIINPTAWAADNAHLAVYNITPTLYQTTAIEGPYSYSGKSLNISQQVLSVNANDTSVLVITEQSDAEIDHTTVVKYGYCSNLFQASFYGSCLPYKYHLQTADSPLRSQCCYQCSQWFNGFNVRHQCHHSQWGRQRLWLRQ